MTATYHYQDYKYLISIINYGSIGYTGRIIKGLNEFSVKYLLKFSIGPDSPVLQLPIEYVKIHKERLDHVTRTPKNKPKESL